MECLTLDDRRRPIMTLNHGDHLGWATGDTDPIADEAQRFRESLFLIARGDHHGEGGAFLIHPWMLGSLSGCRVAHRFPPSRISCRSP
jgi:hypothetical protein